MDKVDKPKAETENNTSPAPKKGKMKLWKKIIIGVGVFIVAIVVLANSATKGVATVSDSFISNLQKGDADSAYALLSADTQKSTTKEQFKEVVDRVRGVLTGKPKMTSKEVQNETGKVVYEIQGNDNHVYDVTVELVKESGAWKVQTFQSTALE